MERKRQSEISQGARNEECEPSINAGKGRSLNCAEQDFIQTINVEEEIKEYVEYLKDLVIICRFIGATADRKRIKDTWHMPQITKFLLRGFFIVIFATQEERQKVLEGGLWSMDSKPLYIQRWHRNFNLLKIDLYDKLLWICLNNLPMEYWTEEALAKIGRSLGTLMDIDAEIALGDSYIYARLQLAAVRKIPLQVKLCAHGLEWIQSVEIEEEKYYCLNCGRQNQSTSNYKIPKKENNEWRPKQKENAENCETIPCLEYKKKEDDLQSIPSRLEELRAQEDPILD
ncbi:hypothetical protein SUGI_0661990 [Cryptomeria japonica]|nr:hypothetical protein SUGI_0661990 [Cryptomeria japonica]